MVGDLFFIFLTKVRKRSFLAYQHIEFGFILGV